MKTIRHTGIALSILMLLLAAMTPKASAGCSATSLYGNYVFRLGPAKGFDADLANAGDPGNVAFAPRQDLVRAGAFTSLGAGVLSGGHTLATTDTNAGATWKVDFTWTGTYTLNADCTGTLTITPAAFGTWVCTDMTLATPATVPCVGTEEGPETYSISISLSNGRVELAETDNNGGGAKIFMAGEALKR